MDSQANEQQQKDFLASLFPTESSDHLQQSFDGGQQNMSMFPFNTSPHGSQQGIGMQQTMSQNPSSPINMDILGSMMQGIDTHGTMSPQGPFNPQSMLEQQFKLTQLQQLQQLQNQIFQQQIALISSQTAGIMHTSTSIDARRDHQSPSYSGLPTPGPSAELHAQQSTGEFISPMSLGQFMDPQDSYRNRGGMDHVPPMVDHSNQSHYSLSRGSNSAPEHIAFRINPSHQSLPSPEFDISPLTSPWLGAHQPSTQQGSNKRNASSSGDEDTQPSRKRQSPAIRPTNPSQAKKTFRSSKSTNSTPLMRSTRSRRESTAGEMTGVAIGEVIGDTPSPVDLSMPPPAPPSNQSSSSSSTASDQPPSPNFNPQLIPVTPASIMNLGRLGINSSLAPVRQMLPPEAKPKGITKPKVTIEPPARSKPARKNTTGSLASPGLKAILPAGNTPPLNFNSSLPLPGPVVHVRKTSHKAAEQKRRDSLKTTFDDLRGLLPPIPLPSDEKPDEPVLPGALPPRGPPKAGGEGPNKGVSKLQLLMCGNDYIRQLKGRVQRRDEEIERLRREVKRLRIGGSVAGTLEEEMEELDLDRDLDAVEAFSARLGGEGGGSIIGDDDGEDDPGED